MTNKGVRIAYGLLPAVLVLAASAMACYKIIFLGYDLEHAIPRVSYYLETVIEFDGHGSPVEIDMSLPEMLSDQRVTDESFQSEDLKFGIKHTPDDRRGVWLAEPISGKRRLGYTATVIRKKRKYVIDSALATTQPIPPLIAGYLLPDSMVQSEDKAVGRLADSLGLHQDSLMLANVSKIFEYVTHDMRYVRFSGTTDALTAYQLGEASCGGKSRLMAALARRIGIPARLVGGKILSPGRSTATHIWTELYIGGYWVPFCPTNNYFAEMPTHYLILYYGERPFLTHTRDINFKFFFNVKKRLVAEPSGLPTKSSLLDIFNIWSIFERASISIELLQIILMLPLGVLVVVIARNLLGFETFGTFMPALIAMGFRETGLVYGLFLFIMIIAFGFGVRWLVNRFRLLHTPRLAIILTSVIVFLLSITAFGIAFGFSHFARVALFPLVIMTLTVERFSLIIEEHSLQKASLISLSTMIVASGSYAVMSARWLQTIVVTFPEVILIAVALFLYLGRYSGFRMVEYFRFRDIIGRASSGGQHENHSA